MKRVLAVATAMLAASALLAAPLSQLEQEHVLRMTYQTPHFNWGKPWFKGTMKVLFFCVGKYEYARDAVELMQRFDMKITPVYFRRNRKVIHFTTANVDREASENPPNSDGVQRLRRLLGDKWDLFLFGDIDPDVLPPELQYYMYKQVADGAGILVIGPNKPDKVMTPDREMKDSDLFPLNVLFYELPAARQWLKENEEPEDLERRLVHAYKLGKGRGVHFALPSPATTIPRMPATPETLNEMEYWYALVGELAIWAAGKNATDEDLTRLGRRGLTLAGRMDAPDGTVLFPWHRKTAAGTDLRQIELEIKKSGVPLARTCLTAAVLEANGKKVMFFAAPISLGPVEPQQISAIALHRDFCEPGEPIAGTVSLADGAYSGYVLRVRTRDAWGRVLARHDIPLKADSRQASFSLPTSEDCSIYMRVEAALFRGGERRTPWSVAEFRVTHRRRGVFHQVQWDAPNTAVGYWAMLKLRQLGWDINLGGLKSTLALSDTPLIPYTTRLMEQHDEHGIMKPCCWNDPQASAEWIKSIVDRQFNARKHGVFCYSLGDETTTKGCCLSPHCLAAYRRYLKMQYGDIAALNKSWGTNFASFDEVTLSKPDDNYEKTAFQQGNYARWFDRLAFSQWNYLQLNKRFGEAFRKLDPQALTGFEGAGRWGDDYELIVRTNGFYNPYPRPMDEVLRSLAPRGYISGNWIGYQREAEPLLYWYWRIILNGRPCVFWWRWDGIGVWHGYIEPDFELYPATAEMQHDTEIVRQGLGDLIIHADQVDDGIAFFYSVAAAQADRLPDSKNFGGIRRAHETWVKLTRAAGFGFRYVTNRQIEAGELRSSKLKVLVLPTTRALSDKCVDEIRGFVEAGGTVIADLRPAEFTGHLSRRAKPALDDLIGVRHTAPLTGEKRAIQIAAEMGGQKLALKLDEAIVDTGTKLVGATAAARSGDAPLLVSRSVGRGRAVLLNFAISAAAADPDSFMAARRFVAALYRACGVRPAAWVDSDDPAVVLETRAWRVGRNILYAAQMANWKYQGGRYVLRLARPMHIYDLKAGKYLGRRRSATLPARRARFFLLAPTPIKPVQAQLADDSLRPGDSVTVRLSVPADNPRGPYAAAVRLYDPGGMEQIWARRNPVLERTAEISLPLGYNAAGGTWKLTVRDLATGRTQTLKFTVAGDNPCIWPGCYRPRE